MLIYGLYKLRRWARESSWSWSYGSWIYNYLCNQCLSPLTLRVRIPLRRCVLETTICDKVCQWFAAGRCFSPDSPVSSTNKTDLNDITEILLKKALSTIKQTNIKIENKCNNVYFRAVMYRQKYLTNDRFDNFYLTYKLLEVDVRRQKMGHESIFPLKRKERGRYIATSMTLKY